MVGEFFHYLPEKAWLGRSLALPEPVPSPGQGEAPTEPSTGPFSILESCMSEQKLIAIDTALPWEERFNEKLDGRSIRKNLIIDPDTGMEVRLVRYPAGVINVRHTHPAPTACMYWKDAGHARGPAWSGLLRLVSEGTVMEHGASAEGDVTVLFITNKPFEIHYQ